MSSRAIEANQAVAEADAFERALAKIHFSTDGVVLRVNDKFLSLSGLRLEDVVGSHHGDLVPPREGADGDLWAALRRGEPQVGSFRLPDGNGIGTKVPLTYVPVYDRHGRPAEVIALLSPGDAEVPAEAVDDVRIVGHDALHYVVQFKLDGTIVDANAQFLDTMGFKLEEVRGWHHRMLLDPSEASRVDYAAFWGRLAHGHIQAGEFKWICKDGREVWMQATYTPVLDKKGRPVSVFKHAVDVTLSKLRQADLQSQIDAIHKAQCVITFNMDGTVVDANDLFLDALGYRRGEIEGRHHRMFVDPAEAASPDYAAFWNALAQGRHQAGEYRRVGRGGRVVWLQATYNPIFDIKGRPCRVVKYATDVTADKLRRAELHGQIAAVQNAQCVITFNMDGTIVDANDLFLKTMGYRIEEVEGRHHRMFVDPAHSHSGEYANFWRTLERGRHQTGEYQRVGKNGRDVWLQATYNPVFDPEGKPLKVVKYATDITQEKLRQADFQGQIAAIHKAICVISFNLDGTVIDANDNFLDAMGYTLAAVRGRHHHMFIAPAEAGSAAYAAFWQALAQGAHQGGEYKRIGAGGREVWLQATYNPIFDMKGRPFKIVKYATDITGEKMRRADFQGQIAAIYKAQCVISFTLEGTILDANDNFLQALGYRPDEVIGQHHRMFVEPGFADSEDYARFWATLRNGSFLSATYKRMGKNGREVWIQASYNPIFDLNGKPFKVVKFATDITSDVKLADAFRDAERQAQHDATTALPNRVRLAGFMSAALAEPQARLVLLYLDLDRFKPINDTYGHPTGDRVLGEVADRLRRALAPEQLVARVGGDEFVVAAPNLAEGEVEGFCQRLIDAVTAPIHHELGELKVGMSIGVAVSPHDARTPDELLRCADVALYRSKANGRGCYRFFSPSMNEKIARIRRVEDDIRRGLAAGEFLVEYQPRFDARTRAVRGVEALVRWNHPVRGRLPPADFITAAEDSDMIVPLGAWVLRTACRAATAWPGITVSVNLSPAQFRDGTLAEVVAAALAETGLDAERLELEITEAMPPDDLARAYRVLKTLKARGVRLAMDNFGDGDMSWTILREVPFDSVKIDRRFIAALEANDGRAAVQSILAFAKALDLSVTAGGVETAGQLLRLTLDECPEVQGFLLAPPMPAEAIGDMLADDGRRARAAG